MLSSSLEDIADLGDDDVEERTSRENIIRDAAGAAYAGRSSDISSSRV